MVLYCSLRHRDAQVLLVTIVLVQEQHSHSHAYQRSFLILHFVFCLLHYSMSNLHTIYHRISSKFQSRSSASGNTLSNGLARVACTRQRKNDFPAGIEPWIWGLECSWTSSLWSYWRPDYHRYPSKYHRLFLIFSVILRRKNFICRNSNLISRMRKTLSLVFPSLWNSSSTLYRIRLCGTLILI